VVGWTAVFCQVEPLLEKSFRIRGLRGSELSHPLRTLIGMVIDMRTSSSASSSAWSVSLFAREGCDAIGESTGSNPLAEQSEVRPSTLVSKTTAATLASVFGDSKTESNATESNATESNATGLDATRLDTNVVALRPALVVSCGDCVMQNTSTCGDCVVTWLLADERGRLDLGLQSQVENNADEVTFAESELDTLRVFQSLGLAPALRHVRRHPSCTSVGAAS
jgi:hypothetical protein